MEITEKLNKKIPDVMIMRIPKFLALTSQYQNFDELFNEDCLMFWIGKHKNLKKMLFLIAPIFCAEETTENSDGYIVYMSVSTNLIPLRKKSLS